MQHPQWPQDVRRQRPEGRLLAPGPVLDAAAPCAPCGRGPPRLCLPSCPASGACGRAVTTPNSDVAPVQEHWARGMCNKGSAWSRPGPQGLSWTSGFSGGPEGTQGLGVDADLRPRPPAGGSELSLTSSFYGGRGPLLELVPENPSSSSANNPQAIGTPSPQHAAASPGPGCLHLSAPLNSAFAT